MILSVGRLELMPFKGKVFGQDSSLKLGGDVLHSRDDAGTNISPALNLKVNADGSLSPFVLPGADERTAWSADAWLNVGPVDVIGEYFAEEVAPSMVLRRVSPISSRAVGTFRPVTSSSRKNCRRWRNLRI